MKARIAITLAAVAALLAGCAGDATIIPFTPVNNVFAGTYQSANVTLDNGKTGVVALTVGADGDANGSLTVSAALVAAGRGLIFGFTPGVHNIHGTVTSAGHFSLMGNDPQNGDFRVEGDLDLHADGTLRIVAGGQTYTSTIAVTHGTGLSTLQITNTGNANILNSSFSDPFVQLNNVGDQTTVFIFPSLDVVNGFLMLLKTDANTGDSVEFNGLNDSRSYIGYTEDSGGKVWYATSGSMTVVSRTATKLEVRFHNAVFTPETGNETEATGSFTLNGSLRN
ncbi:MAG TPA: hypothetical protein VK934_00700 [Fimbriimonas sp.]|nr:hypothetical protein [Fimbriimonas sp.]